MRKASYSFGCKIAELVEIDLVDTVNLVWHAEVPFGINFAGFRVNFQDFKSTFVIISIPS